MPMSPLNPNDQSILKNLAALEEAGERGFSIFHSGDTQNGTREMRESLQQSAQNISSIQDPELRKQAKALLKATNEAIQAYIKNPSDQNLTILRTDVITYKEFLDQQQKT